MHLVWDINLVWIFLVGMPLALDPSGLSLIFTAGALALLSPCGFPMLPGYMSYYIGTEAPLEKAVSGRIVCTLGLPIIVTTILIAKAKELMLKRIVKMMPFFQKISSIILIIIGIYLIYFYYACIMCHNPEIRPH